MPSLQVIDTDYVYRNPNPERGARNATFPTLVRLPEGELLCAMDIGEAMSALDKRSYLCRSSDEGKTWSAPVQIFEPDESAHPVDTSVRISLAPDGELLGLTSLCDRHRTEAGHANPDTEGFVETQMAIVRSADRGRTWSGPHLIEPAIDWNHFETCAPFTALPGGRVLGPTAIFNDWEGNCRYDRYAAMAFLSDDNGSTWPRMVEVMNLSKQDLSSWEQKQAVLSDGRLMAMCWCHDYVKRESQHNRYTFSTDNGDSFGPPIECPIHGETNTIHALPGNHVLSVYRRVDQRGCWAQLARIEGDAWLPLADCPRWGTDVASYEADGCKDDTKGVWGHMESLQFGCPSIVSLGDGEVLTAFWCTEPDGVTVIRWYRVGWDDS